MLFNGAEQKHARVHVHDQLFSNLWRAHASSVYALVTSSAGQRRPRKELGWSKIHFDGILRERLHRRYPVLL